MKWWHKKGKGSYCGAEYFGVELGIDEILNFPIATPQTSVKKVLYDWAWLYILANYNNQLDRNDFAIATYSVYNSLKIVFYNRQEYLDGKATLKLSRNPKLGIDKQSGS